MSDQSDEMMRRRRAQETKEYLEYTSQHAKAHRQLDWAWELELARRTEAPHRRRCPDEKPERGEYDPIERHERETGRRQQQNTFS
jgi:hypothetical protein